jgi:hypothetical protein
MREALVAGRIGAAATSMIISFLDRMIPKVGRERAAESMFSPGSLLVCLWTRCGGR